MVMVFLLVFGAAPSFAIDSVNVFTGTQRLQDQTVVVHNGRIAMVAAAAPTEGLERIDGRGMTVVPGFIDAHVHSFGGALPDAVRFGVTTVLDMFTTEQFAAAERPKREMLTDVGQADLYSSGFLATSEGGHGTEYGVLVPTVAEPAEADAWVQARVEAGADYIKIVYIHPSRTGRFTSIDVPTMKALVDAAHARERLAIVHVQDVNSAAEAVRAGADGLAHTLLDREAPNDLLDAMVAQNTFVITTLGVMNNLDPARKHRLPSHLRNKLSGEQRGTLDATWTGSIKPELFRHAMANIERFHRRGIPVLAGSDAPNPGTAHGVSLLAELLLMVEAGMSAEEALAAATWIPAQVFGLSDRGRLRPGARADMVMVRGDPTRDIARVFQIERVWKNGYMVAVAPDTQKREQVTPMTVSSFDKNLNSAWGVAWTASSDSMMGGKSEASIKRVQGKSGAGLGISGVIRPGFIAPWSGAFVSFAADWSALRDLTEIKKVSFDVRGTDGSYRLMFFGEAQNAPPMEHAFKVGEDWSRVSVPLSAIKGLDPRSVRALGVSAAMKDGEKTFEIVIDQVRFE